MAHNHNSTDSPLSRRIVRAFLHFLNSVEPGPGVDAEGIQVARECLTEAFKLNSSSVDGDDGKSESLIDIFKSLEANKQNETRKSDVDTQWNCANASSSFSASKDELCGQFFAALEKNHYFRRNTDGSDDMVQLEKACSFFDEGCKEMVRSGCQQFCLMSLAESLKTLGNKAMQSKKYNDAIELYNCAVALNEKNAVYFCNRAAAYTQINKYSEAIQDCLRSIKIDPNYSKAYSRLGLVYYAQGNYRDAIDKGFRKALQLDPNNGSVKENIRVAEQKLFEEQNRAHHNQNPTRSSQEGPNQTAQPTFSSVPFNPSQMANMLRHMTSNATNSQQRPPTEEWEQETTSEIRFGADILNMEQIPENLTGAVQSMMEILSRTVNPGQPPEDQTNPRTGPN
ncbi:small glutamine-rich tetratricopeptide repeat-containing protein alpha isoform X3 [Vigna radiata var. radiata]|uniref:Small glutamine-rich tetratricopeptide repeat-containing protein alpha isoform X3 n=1 Tax=Vigna radiata var. radiata TaxID=3916 RepID=A0A3Q0F244_VIGRR|nr:small glutamine-rich tetratricopeptide repeat-containing protein alpha isoform X3 [Vigna radiata var. radiata]